MQIVVVEPVNERAHWVPHLVGARREIVVAMDWTDFDHDGQATLALNLVTSHEYPSAARQAAAPPSPRYPLITSRSPILVENLRESSQDLGS